MIYQQTIDNVSLENESFFTENDSYPFNENELVIFKYDGKSYSLD